jgi:biotin carboxyl carrier protein
MKVDIKINDRIAEVEMVENTGSIFKIRVDDKIYEVDSKEVKEGVFSILNNNKSYLIDINAGTSNKNFEVTAWNKVFPVDIIDAEAKYLMSRGKGAAADDENVISSPMPGKVVKILVEEGQEVKAGDTVIIVSAMKMESEYKVKQDSVVKEVCVSEDDTIDGNQPLIIVE